MLMLRTGQIFSLLSNNIRPLPKEKQKEKKNPGRSEACLADLYIFYLCECAHWSNILWNHTAKCDLKNQILWCARGRKHEQPD